MTPVEHFMKDTQFLLSQVLHDLISPFTSLSAGLDILSETNGEIWQLIKSSRDQLYNQLILFRFIFNYTEGSCEEAKQILFTFSSYANSLGIKIEGDLSSLPKITICLGLWMIKQCRPRTGGTLYLDKSPYFLQLVSNYILPPTHEENVLQNGASEQIIKESYAAYAYRLLLMYEKKASIQRTPESVSILLNSV